MNSSLPKRMLKGTISTLRGAISSCVRSHELSVTMYTPGMKASSSLRSHSPTTQSYRSYEEMPYGRSFAVRSHCRMQGTAARRRRHPERQKGLGKTADWSGLSDQRLHKEKP